MILDNSGIDYSRMLFFVFVFLVYWKIETNSSAFSRVWQHPRRVLLGSFVYQTTYRWSDFTLSINKEVKNCWTWKKTSNLGQKFATLNTLLYHKLLPVIAGFIQVQLFLPLYIYDVKSYHLYVVWQKNDPNNTRLWFTTW